METEPITKLIDALSARTRFGEVMEKADKQNVRFLVSRRGKPKCIILGVEDYLKNVVKQPKMLASIQLDAQKGGLDALSEAAIDAEIKAYRKSKRKKSKR